jgi:hypothetical protein
MSGTGSRANTREQEVWDLLVAGWGLDEITQQVGFATTARTSSLIETALTRRKFRPGMEQDRALQLARLDRLQARWWDAALSGDATAALLVERIIEHRTALLGLLEPTPDLDPTA